MEYEVRQYQIDCEDALLKDVLAGFNPVIAVPTGAGKTKIMGGFIYKYLEVKPADKILIISNTEDILKQDHEAIKRFFPGIIIGLYSAGLNSRTVQKITVGGIQSIYNKPELFRDFNVIIIDEAHTIPPKNSSMYMKFFNAIPGVRHIGLSATVYRMGTGYIYQGDKALFNKLSYDLSSMDDFNKLVEDGYLSELISKRTDLEMDTKGVKTTGGDFNQKDLSVKFDRDGITQDAIKESIEFGQHNYKSWLIFAIDIKHADHIAEELNRRGIKTRALHTGTKKDRPEIIRQFKAGEIRALSSVGMVTTGFDAPNIDLIILLRPTKSAVLHVQMIGRGLRKSPETDKTHCLVLDFAGNTKRLGPINNVLIPMRKKKGEKKGEPPVKECPRCKCLVPPVMRICNVCGHVFEFKEKIRKRADDVEVVQKKKWIDVSYVEYYIHKKTAGYDSLKVVYQCGMVQINEFVCLNHEGYPKMKADNWIKFRWPVNHSHPRTVKEAFKHSDFLKVPKRLLVVRDKKYYNIEDISF